MKWRRKVLAGLLVLSLLAASTRLGVHFEMQEEAASKSNNQSVVHSEINTGFISENQEDILTETTFVSGGQKNKEKTAERTGSQGFKSVENKKNLEAENAFQTIPTKGYEENAAISSKKLEMAIYGQKTKNF